RSKPPQHQELLDWLAVEFMEPVPGLGISAATPLGAKSAEAQAARAWDMKRFLKMLVTSATYRQSSRATPELLEKDPDNRLLARGPRFRASAETIRDQALFASGLL